MSYFAHVPNLIDGKGLVGQVIAADQLFINAGHVGDPREWYQTSYNTRGGVHFGQDGQPDGGIALRANYAGIGYTLDTNIILGDVVGVFYAPQPFPSWTVSEPSWVWAAPVPYPAGTDSYMWDEPTLAWIALPTPVLPAPAA
jgi:hypothetical protein